MAHEGGIGTAGTRERILDAALELFAEKGFHETSLRSITAAAGANLAAVNYHFGSKEALIAEVFARLIGPINRERLKSLDRIEAAHPEAPLPLDEVVAAFIGPPLLAWKRLGSASMRFVARIFAQPDEVVLRLFKEQFSDVVERFGAAFRRALPDLDQQDLLWRYVFALGAMIHTMLAHERLRIVFGEVLEDVGADEMMKRMTSFIVAGMRAPARPGGGA